MQMAHGARLPGRHLKGQRSGAVVFAEPICIVSSGAGALALAEYEQRGRDVCRARMSVLTASVFPARGRTDVSVCPSLMTLIGGSPRGDQRVLRCPAVLA